MTPNRVTRHGTDDAAVNEETPVLQVADPSFSVRSGDPPCPDEDWCKRTNYGIAVLATTRRNA